MQQSGLIVFRKSGALTFTLLFLFSLMPSTSVAREPRSTSTSWTGYLIDLTCARERKDKEADLGQSHTKRCMEMPACAHSGYGLLTGANELLPFDENGNRLVRLLLQRINQKNDLRVIIQGIRSGDSLQVKRLVLKKR
jgi:hypothetical protein